MSGFTSFWMGLGADQRTMVTDLVFTVILPFMVATAARTYQVWAAKLPAPQHNLATDLVSQVVAAVEQLYSNAPAGSGAAKKAEAEKLASALLAHFGVKVDPSVLNVLIEAAVAALHQGPAAAQGIGSAANPPAAAAPVAAPPAMPPATAAIRVGTA